jgi:dihydropteroate synthase
MTLVLDCGGRLLPLDRPLIMGVVNVTPDSFSDGGAHLERDAAVAHALRLVEEGADLIDVGGESTRPGSHPVSVAEEIARVVPVVERFSAAAPQVPISIDTSKAAVMRAAVAAGASFVNDVRALRERGALETVAELGVPVCLMHMQGTPRTMQDQPFYDDVVGEVAQFLAGRIAACRAAGIGEDRIVVDPGFGFGKSTTHNLELLRRLEVLTELGRPVMVGLSRKRTIGEITGREVADRLVGSVVAAVLAVQRGASIVRVHDVAATRDALAVLAAVEHG